MLGRKQSPETTELLTFMFGLGNQLSNHGLDDTNVSIEKATESSAEQSHPDVGGEPYHDHAEHGS